MYYCEIGLGINVYFAYGYIIEEDTNKTTDLKIGVKIDSGKSTFSILPYEYLEKNKYLGLKEGNNTNFREETEVKNKKINTFKYTYINDEAYVNLLLENYINRCYSNTKNVYNSLDNEYKQKRFGDIKIFEDFLEQHKNKYMSFGQLKKYDDFESNEEYIQYLTESNINLEIEGYHKVIREDYIQYTCVDNFKNYYIFRETAPMEYTLLLDIYTIDLPEFIEKYEKGTTEEKVGYNIEKIVNAINAQDYNYIYSKLADEFKENNFKTYEDFKIYANETFDIGNEITYNKYTESQNLSTYEITLKGKDKTVKKTIVMRLEEGTEYVFSFNVE